MGVKALLLHLRLNWQLILMPIFLWGFLLSEGPVGPKFWLGLFTFHVLFYGGSVAFNSYYDRDEGPIGGLWNPPRPTASLLLFSLALQAIGMVLVAAFINTALLVVSLVMFALSVAYSHPAVRLKSRPYVGLLTVSLGQGVGGAVAGWLCGRGDWTSLGSWRAVVGFAVSALITTAFYPLSQVYQRAEDEGRGDITFAVVMGRRCFPFAMACFVAAAGLGGWMLGREFGVGEGLLVGVGLLLLAGLVGDWWRQFDDSQVRQNYQRLMRLGYVMGFGFIVFIGWHLIGR